jgi:thioredoxin reductase (NADPH)
VLDIVIVGGGPAGLSAGIYCGRAMLETLIVEEKSAGGQLMITDKIENYPGFPEGIGGFELTEKLKEHAKKFGAKIKEYNKVEKVVKEGKVFKVFAGEETITAKAVIWAGGVVPKTLGVPGEKEFLGRGVSYCAVCDGAFFKGMEVAVVGGGDSALQESLFLTNFASKVYIIHRRDSFRAIKILQEKVKEHPKIEVLFNRVVEEIKGDKFVESLVLRNKETNQTETLKVSGVFVFIGNSPNVEGVKDLVELSESGFIKTNENLETKTPGLFAAGDVREKPLRQVVTAVSDGAISAMSAYHYIESCWG